MWCLIADSTPSAGNDITEKKKLRHIVQSRRLLKTVILQGSVILQNSVTFIITENCNIKSKITEYCNIRKQGVKESHTGYYCSTACIL